MAGMQGLRTSVLQKQWQHRSPVGIFYKTFDVRLKRNCCDGVVEELVQSQARGDKARPAKAGRRPHAKLSSVIEPRL
jgi:hypothetical protein